MLSQTFQLNHIKSSCIFLSRRSRIVTTNLFKNTLQRKSVPEDVLLKRKYFTSETFLANQIILNDHFPRGELQEPQQNIRQSTFQQDLTASRHQLLSQRAPSLHMAAILKPHLVTKTNGDRDRSLNYELYPEAATEGVL